MKLVKSLLIPSALALASTVGLAVPAGAAPIAPSNAATAEKGVSATPVYHRGYYHNYRNYGRSYRYWRPYRYWYGPRCYWSRYWHRTICR